MTLRRLDGKSSAALLAGDGDGGRADDSAHAKGHEVGGRPASSPLRPVPFAAAAVSPAVSPGPRWGGGTVDGDDEDDVVPRPALLLATQHDEEEDAAAAAYHRASAAVNACGVEPAGTGGGASASRGAGGFHLLPGFFGGGAATGSGRGVSDEAGERRRRWGGSRRPPASSFGTQIDSGGSSSAWTEITAVMSSMRGAAFGIGAHRGGGAAASNGPQQPQPPLAASPRPQQQQRRGSDSFAAEHHQQELALLQRLFRLRHSNVVGLFGTVTVAGRSILVEEYVEMGPLSSLLSAAARKREAASAAMLASGGGGGSPGAASLLRGGSMVVEDSTAAPPAGAERHAANDTLPFAAKRSVALGMAAGLHYLHSQSPPVVMRLSPRRVLVGSSWVPKLRPPITVERTSVDVWCERRAAEALLQLAAPACVVCC